MSSTTKTEWRCDRFKCGHVVTTDKSSSLPDRWTSFVSANNVYHLCSKCTIDVACYIVHGVQGVT